MREAYLKTIQTIFCPRKPVIVSALFRNNFASKAYKLQAFGKKALRKIFEWNRDEVANL
jgi:hypothetical protein